jgi:predicted NUDIX family NTP pyrophosphohydrolase
MVEIEWPRGSGRLVSFPEIDAARWMTVADARQAMLASQRVLLDRLNDLAGGPVGT